MGDHLNGDAILKKTQLLKFFGLLKGSLRHLAELPQRVWPVCIEAHVTPMSGSGVVAVKWNK